MLATTRPLDVFALRSLWLAAVFIVVMPPALAQMTPGRVAVTAAIPQGPDVGMSYAFSENLRLNLGIGFATAKPDQSPTRSEFLVRPSLWYVQKAADEVSVLYGGALEFVARSGGGSTSDVGVLLQAGAEYAVSRSFAIGAVAGLGYAEGGGSAFGAKGSRFGTVDVELVLTWWVF